MASVTSFGIHQPIGLSHAVEEQFLPPNPSPDLYTWEVIPDDGHGGDDDDEGDDELLVTRDTVLWSRGGIFRKSFNFAAEKEPISQALLTRFPTPVEGGHDEVAADGPWARPPHPPGGGAHGKRGRSVEKSVLSKALVVFLKTQAHIFFLSGTSHIVHMPFEVEFACAAPVGVIIQRKSRADNLSPVTLKFPRVPPNTFVSSQLSPPAQRMPSVQLQFSTEGLGRPKTLPLRLSSTLENMWEPPLETSDSHWPRLVCLMDPFLELGLVVTQPSGGAPKGRKRRSSIKSPFLDLAEEILHIEAMRRPGQVKQAGMDDLVLAVTVNRETNMYTIWKLSYLEPDDIFTAKPAKKKKTSLGRRRSSMQPGLPSGATTPVQASFRESLGGQLPVKKTRKSERLEKPQEQPLEMALQDPDKAGEVTRRQSRRISSLLARADLSTSHDRGAFTDSMITHPGGRRIDSHGSQRGRVSGNYAPMNMSGTYNQNLNSLLEAPSHDDILESLRAGGDFEGFQNIGLEDDDLDGLSREILLTKVHSISMENANVRYSLSDQPAKNQCKVYIVVGPPYAVDEPDRTYLLLGIQDPVDKRLQLLTLHVQARKESAAGATSKSRQARGKTADSDLVVTWGRLLRVQSVVDSCKITDGDQSMILVLSENQAGHRELSVQALWSELTKLTLPALFEENVDSLEFGGSHVVGKDGQGSHRRSLNLPGSELAAVCHPKPRGMVDIRDKQGRFHRVRVQLEPSTPQVRQVLHVCRSLLPDSQGERMLTGWWHVMQWLTTAIEGREAQVANLEWSCLVIELFVLFLALDPGFQALAQGKQPQRTAPASPAPRELSKWEQMQALATPRAAVAPAWMQTKGWRWLLDDPFLSPLVTKDTSGHDPSSPAEAVEPDFISQHIAFAKEFMATPAPNAATATGTTLVGQEGYLPTAQGRSLESRRSAAWSIIMGLHFLLEEQKLDIFTAESLFPGPADLRLVVCQIARWLRWHDFVQLYELGLQSGLDARHDGDLDLSPPLPHPGKIPSVLEWIQSRLSGQSDAPFLTLADVYSTAVQQSQKEGLDDRRWSAITPRMLMFQKYFKTLKSSDNYVEIVETLHACGFTSQILETLPEALVTPFRDAIAMCQSHPPPSWSAELLELVDRSDVSMVLKPDRMFRNNVISQSNPSHTATRDFQLICRGLEDSTVPSPEDGAGSERQAVVRALFKDDRRLNEAQNLLSTQKPRLLRLDPHPKWTDVEYLERQKELVTTVATGTLAIPAGRGMLYYALSFPLLTQKFPIGGFQLTCNIKPAGVAVSVDKSMFTEEKVNWAFFHQGVASGLAISPQAKGIDTSWILYNKPGNDLNNRHAGFLLALGLNGHLKSVAKWVAFKYLTPKHTMTSIGLLLGLAASYLGTMDSLITRLLSVHVTRMLPPRAAELNLSHLTQTTGIMGIGLLYCNTQHRRMSEIMMSEIEHIEDEDEEDPLRNESYRLAAGFALGFINLGKGTNLKGLHDMRLTEKLLTTASAPKKVELVNVLDRSAPGAVMAIALIFMKSEDHIVARKIDVPDSVLQFDYVRPDVLLLRTVAKNLILWSRIEPTADWIHRNLPPEHRKLHRAFTNTAPGPPEKQRQQQQQHPAAKSTDLPFLSIMAGLCFAIALRFSGSANERVRNLLVSYLDGYMRVLARPAREFDAQMARASARSCVDLLALSCATVMAGTGDLVVLRRLRALHGRDDAHTTYGSHMAAHLAIGTLFLGCGTATFGTSDLAVASLLVAFYPLFPTTVQDNRSHLQAFRHFWVLATEPRCLVVKDMATAQPISVPVMIQLKGRPAAAPASTTGAVDVDLGRKTEAVNVATTAATATPEPKTTRARQQQQQQPTLAGPVILRRQTPCLLPPLEDIATVRTDAAALGYWDLSIDFTHSASDGNNNNIRPKGAATQEDNGGASSNVDMIAAFRANQCLHLRRRPARDGVFGATIQALGRHDDSTTAGRSVGLNTGGGATAAAGASAADPSFVSAATSSDPLEWVFSLPSLRGLTHAERAAVLDRASSWEDGSGAVDARLVLEEALEAGGRDDLLGLRLLFEWADRRGAANDASSKTRAAAAAAVVDDEDKEKQRKRRNAKGKGKGVQIAEPPEEAPDDDDGGVAEESSGWWMRDSVVEMLKGKAWLASQNP